MESKPDRPTADEASAALLDAEAMRATLADRIVTPSWFFVSLGVAIAVQIATVAVGLGDKPALDAGEVGAAWLVAVGVAVFAAVAGVQLARFRRLNGVWLGGFASRVVLGTATAAAVSSRSRSARRPGPRTASAGGSWRCGRRSVARPTPSA